MGPGMMPFPWWETTGNALFEVNRSITETNWVGVYIFLERFLCSDSGRFSLDRLQGPASRR